MVPHWWFYYTTKLLSMCTKSNTICIFYCPIWYKNKHSFQINTNFIPRNLSFCTKTPKQCPFIFSVLCTLSTKMHIFILFCTFSPFFSKSYNFTVFVGKKRRYFARVCMQKIVNKIQGARKFSPPYHSSPISSLTVTNS